MLRRRLMLFLGSLVAMLLLASILSVYLLQGVLVQLDHAAGQDGAILQTANSMTDSISDMEIQLRGIPSDHNRHLESLLSRMDALKAQTEAFGRQYQGPIPKAKDKYDAIQVALGNFQQHVAMLATVDNESLARAHTAEAITASIALRQEILGVTRIMREHISSEERDTIAGFRGIVFGITLGFLLVINISFFMLYRVSVMVSAPVEQLVEASRRLAHEEFTCRVYIPGRRHDEFNELAEAYNQLAARLQANEQRKIETLTQAAITLNHELNNASAIIKLQLQLLRRQNVGNPAFERALHQINESVERMTRILESLKHVRRIVLTNYTSDTKMLDLEKSTMEIIEHESAVDMRTGV